MSTITYGQPISQNANFNKKNLFQTPQLNEIKSYHEINFYQNNYANQPNHNHQNSVSERDIKLNNFSI